MPSYKSMIPAGIRTLRLSTGWVLFTYVCTHFINHACGLISLDAMQAYLAVNAGFWQSPLGRPLLYYSLLTHVLLALWALYDRDSFRMPKTEWLRLVLGFSIPFLAAQHVVNTRLGNMLFGVRPDYASELAGFWVLHPASAWVQTAFLVVVWWHACLGLRFVFKTKPWFPRRRDALMGVAYGLPALAFLGFAEAGMRVRELAQDPVWVAALKARVHAPTPAQQAALTLLRDEVWLTTLALIALVLAARRVRLFVRSRRAWIPLFYDGVHEVRVLPGTSILDASRGAGIAHASICGGRGRCSTCRVRVSGPGCETMPASADEQAVLRRVAAAPDVRLACQFRPAAALSVTRLLDPATVSARDAWMRPSQFMGQEREIAVLFADLRGFTRLSEHKLPYDVVYILNRYFAEMGEAVSAAGGRVDKFMGDGVMALFGLAVPPRLACRQALEAARGMSLRLEGLNRALAQDLAEPLRIGIGIHCGPVIVGEMGHGAAFGLTAVGDTVNTASRLEALCKPNACELVVSQDAAEMAGVDLSAHPLRTLEIRGRERPLEAHTLGRAGDWSLVRP